MQEEKGKYQNFEFTGYLYKRNDTKWGTDIRIRTLLDESESKFPQHILVSVSKKNIDKLSDVGIGDKVRVVIIPTLVEGVSDRTQKAYAINKLNLQDFEILDRAAVNPSDEDDDDGEELPF